MKFVHIGIVVRDINTYLKNNVISNCSEIIYDEIQDADICFVENKTAKVGIELIQPKSNNSTVYNFLQKTDGGLHHLCYSVRNVDEAQEIIADKNMIPVYGPVKAIALKNHMVLFAYSRNKELIEFEVVG